MSMLVYNLNFTTASDFQPFEVAGYEFEPITAKQPSRTLQYNPRKMYLNARLKVPPRQLDSVFFPNGRINFKRRIKFHEDLLMLVSILIGRNVVPHSHRDRREFPLCLAKHCDTVSHNSDELRDDLVTIVHHVLDPDWCQRFDDGFHVKAFYLLSNITTVEPRFLGDASVWEHLYFCRNRGRSYDDIVKIKLSKKIGDLVEEYFLPASQPVPDDRLRIFADLRNQFAHSGKLPIQNPKSPYSSLSWDECRRHIDFFKRMTQALVLRTMGCDAIDRTVGGNLLKQLVRKGHI